MSAKETIEKLQNARIITALVTPFKENGQINFGAFPKLIEDLLANHRKCLLTNG
ncbi:4-hydroxy-tetrahydrodipicolinate synthase [Lactococcus lactis]|nr:4-hydroxy-tetrahydrodipicolinate synthase [Lactococcus lactis]